MSIFGNVNLQDEKGWGIYLNSPSQGANYDYQAFQFQDFQMNENRDQRDRNELFIDQLSAERLQTIATDRPVQQISNSHSELLNQHNLQQNFLERQQENNASSLNKSIIKLSKSVSQGLKKKKKNQYDKNIFSNISHIVIKTMLKQQYLKQINRYCLIHKINSHDFYDYFAGPNHHTKWGTSEMSHFFKSKVTPDGIKKVFAYFMVRFLKEEYPMYVMMEGQMRQKLKYLKCGINMSYIPHLLRQDYQEIFRSSPNE